MSDDDRPAGERAFRTGPPRERTHLRDNLEYFALLILVVLMLRQLVVEAYRIEFGSMAPTLLGAHYEERCPNCGYVFNVGRSKEGYSGEVECPNCGYDWDGVIKTGVRLRQPAWLWNEGVGADGAALDPTTAAGQVERRASRIFVNKLVYRFREPRRWEVVVFLFPEYQIHCRGCNEVFTARELDGLVCPGCGGTNLDVETKNYIKRLIGLPGEQISLRDGDVYVDGEIARKPRDVQEDLWMHVFDSAFMPRRFNTNVWDAGAQPSRVSVDGESGTVEVDAVGASGPVAADYARTVRDYYAYDGPGYSLGIGTLGAAGRHVVGDVRIRARVRLLESSGDAGQVVLGIDDAGHEFRLAAGLGLELRDESTGAVGTDESVRLSAGESAWLSLENCDGRVTACVDGRPVLVQDYEPSGGGARAITLGAQDAHVEFERVIIERDIYYAPYLGAGGRDSSYDLGEGEYFVVGDNCPASSDSRAWRRPGVPRENMIGQAFFVFWPVHHIKWLNSDLWP